MKTRKLASFIVRYFDLSQNWARKGFSTKISTVFDPKIVVLLLYLCSACKKKYDRQTLKNVSEGGSNPRLSAMEILN